MPPPDDEWPEGSTEDGAKLFLNDKLLVPENRVEALIDHWHNTQHMHPSRARMQRDLEWNFEGPPGYYAILNRYGNDCAACRARKSPSHSTARNSVHTAIPEAPMRSIAMDVFAMPEVTMEGGNMIVLFLPWTDIAGISWRFLGKKSKTKDKEDNIGVGL